jgi:hypothetical protein
LDDLEALNKKEVKGKAELSTPWLRVEGMSQQNPLAKTEKPIRFG